MKSLKILVLIDLLSEYENGFSGFEYFLISGSDEVSFWRHIVSCKGRYEDSLQDREDAFPLIYGGEKPYRAHRMQTLVSTLKEQIRYYMIIRDAEMNITAAQVDAKIYRAHKMYDKVLKVQKEGLEFAENQDISTASFSKWIIYDSQNIEDKKDTEILQKCKKALSWNSLGLTCQAKLCRVWKSLCPKVQLYYCALDP